MSDRARRNLLWLGGIALAYGVLSGGPRLMRRAFPPDFDFEPVPGLPGFRRIATGDVSAAAAGSPALIGLDAGVPDTVPAGMPPAALSADPCGALFGEASVGGDVPVAYFVDFRCVWCRVVTPMLLARAEGAQAPIRIAWHDLPLLGDSSRIAARAAIAAGLQGRAAEWHARVNGGRVVPSPAYLRRIAEEIGLDPDRLIADMQSPATDRRLAISRGLADLFDFYGTPALVVGRSAVLGRIDAADLDRLIALERAAGKLPCG